MASDPRIWIVVDVFALNTIFVIKKNCCFQRIMQRPVCGNEK